MGSYYLGALAIVLAIPVAGIGIIAGAILWARDVLGRSPVLGSAGILLTLAAAGNLLVVRACEGGVNRPAITAFVGPAGCRPASLAALNVVVLLAVSTALVVRAGDLRR